jgi:23S rRNA pseudouridine1911/1915/1917 synthase
MSLPGARLSFVLGANPNSERLDAIVVALLKDAGRVVSRSTVRQWVDEGRVRVDGFVAKPAARPAAGVRIDVDPAPAPPSAAEPDPSVHVEILHADEHLLVVNKPAGLVVHPARGHVTGTLVNGLLAHHCFDPSVVDGTDPDATFRPGIVHRLDKDTSGVLVVARTGTAREGLKKLFATHDIDREYQAVVVGRAVDTTYDTPYGRHPTNRLKFTSKNPAGDKRAITHVRVQERLAGDAATLVRCRLETGRTHQIRVHLFERGATPVLGDALYGPSAADPRVRVVAESLGRHWLHAGLLGFVHPVTLEALRFESPVPPELLKALAALRD